MMWEGEVLQLSHEMKRSLSKVTDTDEAWKQINYFTNNQDRIAALAGVASIASMTTCRPIHGACCRVSFTLWL